MGVSIKHPENKILLEQPIDPATYKLGPGDMLTIFIWGNVQAQYDLTVTPEGKILVPTIGPIEVAGMHLSSAKKHIEKEVLKRLQNVRVTADLIGLRSFRVSIGGAVNFPGIYSASNATRISELLSLASGPIDETEPPDSVSRPSDIPMFPAGQASSRNIIVSHVDGSIDTADVLMFEQTGRLRYNFRVTDGDEIFVPLREEDINMYGIFGGVKNPGFFEYSPRDSLKDLVSLAHGLTLDADSSTAELVRFEPDGRTLKKSRINLKMILTGQSQDIKMRPDDRVYIKTYGDYNEKHQVLILGEVKFPGFYAIIPESTYLSQVIEEAGGFTPLASLTEAEMTRFTDEEITDGEFERLKLMRVSDMTNLEYGYYKIKSREKPGRIAVDFRELFYGSGQGDVLLKNGDVVNIPRKSETINVAGEIANPGLLGYNPEFNYKDYIRLAGGFSFRADKKKVRIIKGATGEWQKAKPKTPLFPGDTILIPEKRKRNYLATIKDVISITANLATVYLVVKEATK